MDQSVSVILFVAAVLVFAGLLFAIITFTKRGPKGIDVEKYRCQWLDIEKQLSRDQPASYKMTVLHADSLLDKALQDGGFAGQTMAERMKAAQKSWSHVDSVWAAHKLRNKIAHEPDTSVSFDMTRRALASFKRALKDLGAL